MGLLSHKVLCSEALQACMTCGTLPVRSRKSNCAWQNDDWLTMSKAQKMSPSPSFSIPCLCCHKKLLSGLHANLNRTACNYWQKMPLENAEHLREPYPVTPQLPIVLLCSGCFPYVSKQMRTLWKFESKPFRTRSSNLSSRSPSILTYRIPSILMTRPISLALGDTMEYQNEGEADIATTPSKLKDRDKDRPGEANTDRHGFLHSESAES